MENNNGRGIFYGVIGVATLIVAIIGATFAYFSASAANNEAIIVGTTTVQLTLDEPLNNTNFYTTMIPVEATHDNFRHYIGFDSTKSGHGTCKDDVGNAICGVYTFGVTNTASVAQTIYGSIKVTDTNFTVPDGMQTTNICYAVYEGNLSDEGDTFNVDVDGTAKDVDEAVDGDLLVSKQCLGIKDDMHDQATKTEWLNTSTTLAANTGKQYYTIVVWLDEAAEKNANDQGKSVKLGVTFNTAGGGSGVTGVINAGAQAPAGGEDDDQE